jgi:adenylylsulfate kinase
MEIIMINDLHPYQQIINQSLRSGIKNHLPLVIWLTGYPGSGKSTIANALEFHLGKDFGAHTYLLDGDNIRTGLNADLGFSEMDRKENIRRVGEVVKLMADAGLIVITAFISPFQADRDRIRGLLKPGTFWEVFISCPLEVCMKRDPKGLYAKALKGVIKEFTGVNSPFEIPLSPELVIKSDEFGVEDCVSQILSLMLDKHIIKKPTKKD